MAQMGMMPSNRMVEAVPGFSKCTTYSSDPTGVFPYYGLASDIREKDSDHWEKQSTALFGLAHFNAIIQQLENLRFTGRLLKEINPTDPRMSSKTDTTDVTKCPSQKHSYSLYSGSENRCEYKRSRSPRFKETHRSRKEDEDDTKDDKCVRKYSAPLDSRIHELSTDQRENSDTDPLEGGPIRSQLYSIRHQPYSMNEERLSRSPRSNETVTLSYESTAEQILQDKEYSEKLNSCLDQLQSASEKAIQSNWSYEGSSVKGALQERTSAVDNVTLPSIVIDDPRDESFFDVFSQESLGNTQVYPEPGSSVPAINTYNVFTTKSGSCGSSRAQSPGCLMNFENRVVQNIVCSPIGSPQLGPSFRIPQGLSSSESSNQSYADTPSPLNYHTPVNAQLKTQLESELRGFLLWNDGYDSTETSVNNNTIDNTELQLVEEVLRDLGRASVNEEPQVVPEQVLNTICTEEQSCIANCSSCPPIEERMNLQYEYTNPCNYKRPSSTIPIPGSSNTSYTDGRTSLSNLNQTLQVSSWNGANVSGEKRLDEFEIPPIVASFESSPSRSNSEGSIMPWRALNLPSIHASERLKEGLNPKEVEKAMGSLLKRTLQELAKPDEDGDTMLMCLVGNPDEFAKKKAYLVPLVERLSNSRDALAMTNHRGEDALYLAAMNCPKNPYVAGYLAAAMLRKGIDISQRLYHTRGDSLIHAVARHGDSHSDVLAELLALRTIQGNAVFDLSKRNYDGRIALHVAVESHKDPLVRTSTSSLRTVKLLSENGSERNVKETRCGDTPLHTAISLSCDPELVKILLKGSSESIVNAMNYNQNTPLHVAAAVSSAVSLEKQKEVCWLLVQAGAQSNIQNRQGKTPLALVSPDRKDAIRRIFYKKI